MTSSADRPQGRNHDISQNRIDLGKNVVAGLDPEVKTTPYIPELRVHETICEADMRLLDESIVGLISADRVAIPLYSPVAARLNEFIEVIQNDPQQSVKILGIDQMLAAYVLRHANSADHRNDTPVISLEQAISRIGTEELVPLFMALGVRGENATSRSLSVVKHHVWRHAVFSGIFCRLLAPSRGVNADEALACGLLHDFGKAMTIACIEKTFRGHTEVLGKHPEVWMDVLERYHVEIGLVIAEKWGFPAIFSEVISTHHVPQRSSKYRQCVMLAVASDEVFALSNAQPNVTENDLSILSSLAGEKECEIVARFLPSIPIYVESFGLPSPFSKIPASLQKLTTTLKGEPCDVSFEVSSLRSGGVDKYKAKYLAKNGISMVGPAAEESSLVRLTIKTDSGPIEVWATVTLCIPEGKDYLVEAHSVELSGEIEKKWQKFCEAWGVE
ncbi:MAG: HDOD domain-containing protein [Pseudomonadota bacterium]